MLPCLPCAYTVLYTCLLYISSFFFSIPSFGLTHTLPCAFCTVLSSLPLISTCTSHFLFHLSSPLPSLSPSLLHAFLPLFLISHLISFLFALLPLHTPLLHSSPPTEHTIFKTWTRQELGRTGDAETWRDRTHTSSCLLMGFAGRRKDGRTCLLLLSKMVSDRWRTAIGPMPLYS